MGLATDLGVATALVRDHLQGCHALVLEANHDPDMLINGPYPWDLKQRVRGRRGHLANCDTAELLTQLDHPGLQSVVLAHLSEMNNLPQKSPRNRRLRHQPPTLLAHRSRSEPADQGIRHYFKQIATSITLWTSCCLA